MVQSIIPILTHLISKNKAIMIAEAKLKKRIPKYEFK